MNKLAEMTVTNEAEAEAFIRACVEEIGLGFHVDTRADDYVTFESAPLFTAGEAVRIDANLERAYEILENRGGPDAYDVGLEAMQPLLAALTARTYVCPTCGDRFGKGADQDHIDNAHKTPEVTA